MESARRIKDYRGFIKSIRINEKLSGIPSNGEFSPYTKLMLNWCGFDPSEGNPGSFNLGIRGKDVDGEYNLFTSVSPDDGGAKCVFVILVQGDYLKDLIRGSQKKSFRGPKSKILGDILLRLRKSSGGDYKESLMMDDKDEDLRIYGSEKAADEKWYTFIYKIDVKEAIEILPVWSDFMSYIGFAPNSQMKKNKQSTGEYFGPGIIPEFIQKSGIKNWTVKRLEIIFPKSWGEYSALQWAKEFGLISPVFKSLKEATDYLKSIDMIKFDEVVVGSHGADSERYAKMVNAVIGEEESDAHFQEVGRFLDQLARVTTTESKVYFTSCYAANSEEKLVKVAKLLGCTVYGSEGINYLGFRSQGGKFWMAKPDGSFEMTGDKPPFVIKFGPGSFLNGVSIAAQSITQEQIDQITQFVDSAVDEWKEFQKNPWGYMASSCSKYIESKLKKAKDIALAPIKLVQDLWNSW